MDAMFATAMAALFSFWIWSLKAEIADLEKEAYSTPGGATVHGTHRQGTDREPRRAAPEPPKESPRPASARRVSRDPDTGVPTWTIT